MFMAKLRTVLVAIACTMFCLSANAEEYIDILTLQRQVDFSWKKQYMDIYGRRINVDVIPIIASVDSVPVIKMESPFISSENVFNVFHEEAVKVEQYQNITNYICTDELGTRLKFSIGNSTNPVFSDPDSNDVYIEYEELKKGENSTELTIHSAAYFLPYEIDYEMPYLANCDLTVQQCMDITTKRFAEFFPDYDLSFEVFRLGIVNALSPYYSCDIRQKINGLPILTSPQESVTGLDKDALGFEVPSVWRIYYMLPCGKFSNPAWNLCISSTKFEILCRPLKKKEVLVSDVPLCNMDKIIQTIEERIEAGYIRNIYSLRFGYGCFFNENEEIILYPVWEIECDYMFNPKKDIADYKENVENPVTSRLYYRTMIVNAQTGQFMDPVELKENLLDCPEIITWEDVQS